MHDVIFAHLLSHEIFQETRKRQLERIDPDSLHQYEVWDSIGASPSLRERIGSIISWFARRTRAAKRPSENATATCVHTSQCAPQS